MNKQDLDKAFAEMISERAVHEKLDVTSGWVRRLRNKLKNGETISIDLKMDLLRKTGWRPDDAKFNRAALVSLLNYYKRTSQAARDKGPEYIIENWERTKNIVKKK